jgi:hypothetical protein
LSSYEPAGSDYYETQIRAWIAYAIFTVFAITVLLVFATLWWWDQASKEALAVLTAVIGVVGTVTGYYFAKGDA